MCESVCFQHAVYRGRIAVFASFIGLAGLLVGICYSIITKDVGGGFTIAAFAGLPVAVLSLIVALWKTS